MKKYLLAMMITLLSGTHVWADEHVNVVQVACYPEFNVLYIEQDTLWGIQAAKFAEEHPEKMMKEYGFYDINSLMESDYYGNILGYHPKEAECQLGEDKFKITILPHTTECTRHDKYYSLSEYPFRITITKNNRLLVDKLLFAWGENGTKIRRIFIDNDKSAIMRISTYPDKYDDGYFFDKSDFVPLTTELFYDEKQEIKDEPAVPCE